MPRGDEARAVVWRVGEALLAAPLAAVTEIAAVGADRRAVARDGMLEIRSPPGVAAPPDCRHAVVVRTGGASIALAAETVEGVLEYSEHAAIPPPPWLRLLPIGHIAGLIRLNDQRVAALLAVAVLADG